MTKNELIGLAKEKLGAKYDTEETNADNKFSNLVDTIISEAIYISNMQDTSDALTILRPEIIEASIIAYENRGAESLTSQSELGQSNSFIDWKDYLQKTIVKNGKRYLY